MATATRYTSPAARRTLARPIAPAAKPGAAAEPFTQGERVVLFLLALALIAPYHIWNARFLATEIAMVLFILVASKRALSLARLAPILMVMTVSFAIGLSFPVRSANLLTTATVFAKLAVLVCFVYVLVQRCRNLQNVTWAAQRVVLPAAFILCLSAIVDRYTEWPFFVQWHQVVTGGRSGLMERIINDYGIDGLGFLILDDAGGAGFAIRNSDIPPWALLGTVTALWLGQRKHLGTLEIVLLAAILLGAAFSMPKRSAILTLGTAVLAYLVLGRTEIERRWKGVLVILTIATALAANSAGLFYQEQRVGAWEAEESVALSRLVTLGVFGNEEGQDVRLTNLGYELEYLVADPRLLFLGSGWDFGAGFWGKPHNTYVAVLVGGGLMGLITLLLAVAGLFQGARSGQSPRGEGILGLVLLVALSVDIAMHGYLTYRLEFPATTLAIWIAWAAILYGNPASVEERGSASGGPP